MAQQFTAEHTFEIVGFVQVYILDVDIGEPPPTSPNCPRDAGAKPWSFDTSADGTPDLQPDHCNLVRARIRCNTYVTSASNNPNSLEVPTHIVR